MVFYAFDVKSAFNESLFFERGLKGKKNIFVRIFLKIYIEILNF